MIHSAAQIASIFRELYSQQPFIFFSPGRINFLGEHIDYNNGFVLPAAIDKGIWFAIVPNDSDEVNIYSADMKEHLHVSLSSIKKINGWKNYLLGVLHQLRQQNFPIQGFNAVFGGNLPVGAGLSSSAAVECGLAYSLNEIFNLHISRMDIALLCQKAEHSFPGVMCGIMDQFANMMGVQDRILLLDCDSLQYELLPFTSNQYDIVLINSKVHHSLAAGEYNVRRQQCAEGLQILQNTNGVKNFRDISSDDIKLHKKILSNKIYERCLYVTEEIERTIKAAELLKQNNITAFGKLMYETHKGLSELYEVSCKELDFLVQKSKDFPAVIGARLMGGGFGGCTINIIEKNSSVETAEKIVAAYKNVFGINTEYYTMKLSDGTEACDVL